MEKKEQDIRGEAKQEIQCLIRGYGLLDDEDSVEKVLELVKRGMQTAYLNDPVKKEMLEYQAAACEKKERRRRKRQRYIQSYWRWSRRTETEKCCIKKLHNYMKQQAGAIWQWISVFRESEN